MSFELHLSFPDESPVIDIVRQLAENEQITNDQAATKLLTQLASRQAGKSILEGPEGIAGAITRVREEYPTYESFFGSVVGPGTHGSKEAVDRYIAELRSEW